jgi:hypothetical protein
MCLYLFWSSVGLIFAIPGFFLNFAVLIVGWMVQVAVYAFDAVIPSFSTTLRWQVIGSASYTSRYFCTIFKFVRAYHWHLLHCTISFFFWVVQLLPPYFVASLPCTFCIFPYYFFFAFRSTKKEW